MLPKEIIRRDVYIDMNIREKCGQTEVHNPARVSPCFIPKKVIYADLFLEKLQKGSWILQGGFLAGRGRGGGGGGGGGGETAGNQR